MNTRDDRPFDPDWETLDSILRGKIQLIQPKRGYRFSVDPVLLAHFAPRTRSGLLIDLGTGCGILPLLLLHSGKVKRAAGIEIQESLAGLAERNAILNKRETACRMVHGDLRRILDHFPPQSAQLVTLNPPFFPVGKGTDNAGEQESLARREHLCTMPDALSAARLIVAGSGHVAVIYPAERLFELFNALQREDLRAKRLRVVHSHAGEKARLVLVEAVPARRASLLIEPPLILRTETGEYTEEAERILNGEWEL